MVYYASDLKSHEYDITGELINSGTQGKIYRLDDDKCIKIYGKDVYKFDSKVFELLKDGSFDGIYKLYELLYSDNSLETILAYTMKYYGNEVDNILDMPIDYTLDNINMLHKTVSILGDNQILVLDRIPQNVILGKDSMTMIDLDSCIIDSGLSKDTILYVNTSNLLYMFKRLYDEGLKKKGINVDDNDELSSYLNTLFGYNKEPVKVLSRRMCGAKTPMDLLYWRC